MLLASMLI